MKPEVDDRVNAASSSESEMEERSPIQIFTDIGFLIMEAREPEDSPKGRTEGCHCPPQTGLNRHVCSADDDKCVRASRYREQMEMYWRNGIPLCIEVLLYPACEHGRIAGVEDRPSELKPMLLEQWTVKLVHKKCSDREQPLWSLMSALRSYLYFSQISAWLNLSHGRQPRWIAYRVTAPGEDGSGTKFTETTVVHQFPVCGVSRSSDIHVAVISLPRSAHILDVACSHPDCSRRCERPPSLTFSDNDLQGSRSACRVYQDKYNDSPCQKGLRKPRWNYSTTDRKCDARYAKDYTSSSSRSESRRLGACDEPCDAKLICDPRPNANGQNSICDVLCDYSRLKVPEQIVVATCHSSTEQSSVNNSPNSAQSRDTTLENQIRLLRGLGALTDAELEKQQQTSIPSSLPQLPITPRKDMQLPLNIDTNSTSNARKETLRSPMVIMTGSVGSQTYFKDNEPVNPYLVSLRKPVESGSSSSISSQESCTPLACSPNLSQYNQAKRCLSTSYENQAHGPQQPPSKKCLQRAFPESFTSSMHVTTPSSHQEQFCDIDNRPRAPIYCEAPKPCSEDRATFYLSDDEDSPPSPPKSPPKSLRSPRKDKRSDGTPAGEPLRRKSVDEVFLRSKPLLKSCLIKKELEASKEADIPVPTQEEKASFRKRMVASASMIFSSRSGLPRQSSPAPMKRNMTSFDFDHTLSTPRAIKTAISCSVLDNDDSDVSPTNDKFLRKLSVSAPATTNSLLGNFEESLLNGRIEPQGVVEGFSTEIGASGSFCPQHIHLPVTAYFFKLSDDNAPSPYLGHINLEGKRGYHVPVKGNVQVTLFNPNKTVVKVFVVMYNLSDMPPNCTTFLRQRTLYLPSNFHHAHQAVLPSYLRYLIHLRFRSSKSGRIYLHTDIRLIFARDKFEFDPKVSPYELRSFTEGPENPKFSPVR